MTGTRGDPIVIEDDVMLNNPLFNVLTIERSDIVEQLIDSLQETYEVDQNEFWQRIILIIEARAFSLVLRILQGEQ